MTWSLHKIFPLVKTKQFIKNKHLYLIFYEELVAYVMDCVWLQEQENAKFF